MKEVFPQYEDLLDINQKILEAIIPIGESHNLGLSKSLDEELVTDLREKTLSSRKPINYYLDHSFFDKTSMLETSKKITSSLISFKTSAEGLKSFYDSLEDNPTGIAQGLEAVLKEDFPWFSDLSEKYQVEASLLLLIFDSPLKPFFEEITRRVEKDFIELWWEPFCPVCGRKSRVARMRKGKRYMACSYCGCQYLTDRFICPVCDNNDPTKQGFISFPKNSAYELNYCEECNQYIKVIYEERMWIKIPEGLEDLLTRELDVFAQTTEIGFSRT